MILYIFVFLFTLRPFISFFFFFNDTATTEIYTLSLHDALPIYRQGLGRRLGPALRHQQRLLELRAPHEDRKSTRLNSSHSQISYAVFCLKKKKKTNYKHTEHTATPHQTTTSLSRTTTYHILTHS